MGANGLVLAAETAIGNNPVQSVQMIKSMIKEYTKWKENSSLDGILNS
jgi:pyruvate kinase